ncbi:putative zinc-binding metallopeptidase [Rhizobium cremeum]|uniref:zinc-binding metallopeptidase family protein n=1 Tax=Rhizobium cremeum TaxID=2813827 RepID=UPI000DE27242
MRLFSCSNCANVVHFDNNACVTCGMGLAYRPSRFDMVAVQPGDGGAVDPAAPATPLQLCANAQTGGCNWLVEDGDPSGFCLACRHNLTIPDLDIPENVENWQRIELAKRYLFYSLMRFGLPLVTRAADPQGGLGFEFLSDGGNGATGSPVMTGHADGLIVLNVAEASDAEREARRVSLGEPFRTLIGHFRHEVGHYYWEKLVRDRGATDDFRAVFGDERADYGEALRRHYAEGPPQGWEQNFISAYAASHPWEDFAETWAHYFHIVDALDTADAFGLRTSPETDADGLALTTTFDSYRAVNAQVLVDAWVPLTIAINSINRSMGQRDLYPFVLSVPVFAKLQYIHDLIHKG